MEKSKVSERLLDAQHEILHLKSSLEVGPHTSLYAPTVHCDDVYHLFVSTGACQVAANSTVYMEEGPGLFAT